MDSTLEEWEKHLAELHLWFGEGGARFDQLPGILYAATGTPAAADCDARWFVRRLAERNSQNAQRLVRIMDSMPNNTSVVLLFTLGDLKLLFTGDAEQESWAFMLRDEQASAQLRDIRVLKVSHHGSTNGTRREGFWDRLARRTTDPDDRERLVTLLSTTSGPHDGVPARELKDTLHACSRCLSTHPCDNQQPPWEVTLRA